MKFVRVLDFQSDFRGPITLWNGKKSFTMAQGFHFNIFLYFIGSTLGILMGKPTSSKSILADCGYLLVFPLRSGQLIPLNDSIKRLMQFANKVWTLKPLNH